MIDGESLLKSINEQQMPPVENWNPTFCGDLDLQIKADGSWFYLGTPIARRRLQILFSRIIKKEDDTYFLVTPVEKVAIKVDWMPFTIIDFDWIDCDGNPVSHNQPDPQSSIQFRDNCDNLIRLTQEEQWRLDYSQGQPLPVVQVRRNLFASFSRSCYYRLMESAEILAHNDTRQVQLMSNGIPFSLGEFVQDD